MRPVDSSSDDDAADQDVIGVGDFLAAAFHVLDAEVDGFADVGEGLRDGLSLGVATGNGGADHDVAAVVGIGFEEDFEIAGGHWIHRSGGDSATQAMRWMRATQRKR